MKQTSITKFKIIWNSPVVLGFVMVCLLATILDRITGGWANAAIFSTYRSSLLNPLTYLRLFTHVFGHAGFEHFIGNATFLLLIGPMLEEKYGGNTLLTIMGITAFITGLVNSLLFSNVALCGASGIVFAFIIMTSFTNFKDHEIPVTFLFVAVIFIGEQVFQGISVKDQVSNLTHIIGGMVGAYLGYQLGKRGNPKDILNSL